MKYSRTIFNLTIKCIFQFNKLVAIQMIKLLTTIIPLFYRKPQSPIFNSTIPHIQSQTH